jgi:chromosome segregation ATPase
MCFAQRKSAENSVLGGSVLMATQIENRQDYQRKVEAQLEKLNAQINEYKAKADQAQADAKVRYYDQLEELQTKRDAAQAKLSELQQASESAWDEIRRGFENAWTELTTSFDLAVRQFENHTR